MKRQTIILAVAWAVMVPAVFGMGYSLGLDAPRPRAVLEAEYATALEIYDAELENVQAIRKIHPDVRDEAKLQNSRDRLERVKSRLYRLDDQLAAMD